MIRCIAVLSLVWAVSGHKSNAAVKHSGVYSPNRNELYAGAFLISKSRLLQSENNIRAASYPESIVLNVVLKNCHNCRTLLTRDYLDFCIEHLSSSSNVVGYLPKSEQIEAMKYYSKNMAQNVEDIRDSVILSRRSNFTLSSLTIAMIPFSEGIANPGGREEEVNFHHRLIRRSYFQATFYSLYRYFSRVVVYVSSAHDKALVLQWGLPYYALIDLSDTLSDVSLDKYFFFDPEKKNPRPLSQLLPKYALLDLISKLRNEWSGFQYIYYTEGDQVLHMRKQRALYHMMNVTSGVVMFTPHRMQTIPLYQAAPPEIQAIWKPMQKISGVELITERVGDISKGSCCDSGRMPFGNCGNWWYNCPKWGLVNHTTWLKFGTSGFTMPLSTEHQGVCTYTPHITLCNIPENCDNRFPSVFYSGKYHASYSSDQASDLSMSDICGEVPFEKVNDHT